MYTPTPFREPRLDEMHALIRAHPLGVLVTHGPDGLQASPVPFLVYADEGERGVLRAHLARANPHWRSLAAAAECLVIFRGDDGYVTPSWYPSKAAGGRVVPTWNYVAVHARGRVTVTEDAGWLRRQLDALTHSRERERPHPWSVDDAPPDFVAAQLRAIVGIEIAIERLEGKWKLSQNRDETDRRGVVAGLRAADDPQRNDALAALVESRLDDAR